MRRFACEAQVEIFTKLNVCITVLATIKIRSEKTKLSTITHLPSDPAHSSSNLQYWRESEV